MRSDSIQDQQILAASRLPAHTSRAEKALQTAAFSPGVFAFDTGQHLTGLGRSPLMTATCYSQPAFLRRRYNARLHRATPPTTSG